MQRIPHAGIGSSTSSSTTGTETEAPTASPTGEATAAPTEEIERDATGGASARRGETSSWVALAAGTTAAAFGAVLV